MPDTDVLPADGRISDLAHLDLRHLAELFGSTHGRVSSPWAILLVRFSDDPADLPSLDTYQQLFTAAGAGEGNNMVDFFRDMTHGKLDVSGSQVFGWFQLPVRRADYVGNLSPVPPGKTDRGGLLAAARAVAAANGVPLADFAGTVVCGYGQVDLCGWLGGMAALCDSYSLQPSLLGQEMGHGYGLDHARRDGSADDYNDPWDVMSTAAFPAMQHPDPEFSSLGPGLNAWNMRSRGWLDESRVWTTPTGHAGEYTVELRPLHRRDLSGSLAAEVGRYLVEFRVPERWDGAIPRACVLVHRFDDNHSYLMSAAGGTSHDLVAGDHFTVGRADWAYGDFYDVEVARIDAESRTATLRITHTPSVPFPRIPELGGLVLGGVKVDGGGYIIVGGRVIPVPPRGPAYELVGALVRYLQTEVGDDVAAGGALRRSALLNVVRQALTLHSQIELTSGPPPGYLGKEHHHTHGHDG